MFFHKLSLIIKVEQPLGFAGQCKNILLKNRFLGGDDFDRGESIVKQKLEKVAPTMFNEDAREASKITEALQHNLPRIFADDDDDEDED